MSLANATVLITGALGGIGTELTRRFLQEGARVLITDRPDEAPRGYLEQFGDAASYLPLDVTSEADWERALPAATRRFGALTALVNLAGIFTPGIPFDEMSAEVWRRHIDVNLTGSFLGCKHAMRSMKATGGGSIVNISSGLAHIMLSDGAAYCVSKAAVLTLTQVAAKAGGKHGVRVNAVLPGAIETPMLWSNLRPGQDPKALLDMLVKQHPIGRIGQPLDVAHAVSFLCDPASSFITGAMLAVDGGQLVD
jgi:NAD(P)-dependent dehydrogenase (short-subunit alcohol dehydrogenase family)